MRDRADAAATPHRRKLKGEDHATGTNTILASGSAFELWDAVHTSLQVVGNRIETTSESPYPACWIGGTSWAGLGLKSTTVLVTDNEITAPGSGLYGIFVDPDVSENNRVIFAGNAISSAGGIYLGTATSGSIVKAEGVPVVDMGTGNWVLP